jgi:hypothetical protein
MTARAALAVLLGTAILAGCGASQPTLVATTPRPSPVTVLVSAIPSPSPATTPKPKPTTAYPTGWLDSACTALSAMRATVNYRGDLNVGLAADDFYAVGQAGDRIASMAYRADVAITNMPRWGLAGGFLVEMQAAYGTMEDAGIYLRDGGRNFSTTTVGRGMTNYSVAVDTLANAVKDFATLGKTYHFTCADATP